MRRAPLSLSLCVLAAFNVVCLMVHMLHRPFVEPHENTMETFALLGLIFVGTALNGTRFSAVRWLPAHVCCPIPCCGLRVIDQRAH